MEIIIDSDGAEKALKDPGGRVIIALTRQEVDHLLAYRRFEERGERLDESQHPIIDVYQLLFKTIAHGKKHLENRKRK